jgi:hypothetical protein
MKGNESNLRQIMRAVAYRLLLLFIGVGCLAACASEQSQARKAVIGTEPALQVGSAEIVLATRDKPYSWPDGTIGILRNGEQYSFFAAGEVTPIRTFGTLDNPVAEGIQVQRIQSLKYNYPYAAGGRVYRDPQTGTLLLFYHAEIRTFPPGYIPFFSELGLALSIDRGTSWHDLGPILRPHASVSSSYFQKQGQTWDVGWGTYALAGEYFYLYFADLLQDGNSYTRVNLAVARAKIADVIDVAVNQRQAAPWMKYYQGTWVEPGLGGRSSPLIEQKDGSFMPSDVVFNTCLNKYTAVILGEPFPNPDLYWSESSDGLKWDRLQKVVGDEGEQIYATLVGEGDDPSLPEKDFFIYYVDSKESSKTGDRNQDAVLMRRRLSLGDARCDTASLLYGNDLDHR